MTLDDELLACVQTLDSPNQADLVAERGGIMLHFDDSSEDAWAIEWFTEPSCKVSYNRLYLDNGDAVSIATRRAYHAGDCLRKLANSVFYGYAAATNASVPVTAAQLGSIIEDCTRTFRFHSWDADSVDARIVGHDAQAIYTRHNTPDRPKLWGKLGRKIDPTGFHAETPILSVAAVRAAVKAGL